MNDADVWETLERFLADEIALDVFEAWLYASPRLEPAMGSERYFAFISLDFRAKHAHREARAEPGARLAKARLARILRDSPVGVLWRLATGGIA